MTYPLTHTFLRTSRTQRVTMEVTEVSTMSANTVGEKERDNSSGRKERMMRVMMDRDDPDPQEGKNYKRPECPGGLEGWADGPRGQYRPGHLHEVKTVT